MTGTRGLLRRRVTGLLALLVLLVLVLGIPAGLLAVAGNPLDAAVPGVGDLLRPDDGSLFLTVLVAVGWLAWATFAVSVLVETAAALRGRPAPHLPALRLQQHAVAALVGAAAVLFTAAGPAVTAAPAAAATRHVTVFAVAAASPARGHDPHPTATTGTQQAVPTTDGPAAAARQHPRHRTHTVAAGESLWSIAEHELGDGARFGEIAALNYASPQLDGRTLDHAHWIRPGWVLNLPAAGNPGRRPGHTRTVHAGDTLSEIAAEEYDDPARYPDIARASAGITQPGGAHLTDPDVIAPGWTLNIPPDPTRPGPAAPTRPNTAGPAAAAPDRPAPNRAAPEAPTTTPSPPPAPAPTTEAPARTTSGTTSGTTPALAPAAPVDAEDDERFPVRTAAGVGSLLAAGVLGLLATRRTAQQRRRRPGRAAPLPTGESADVEQDLRATGDPLSVATVDLALRALAARCAHTGQPLPVVRAARLTGDQFDLYLAEPAALPDPWTGTADATVWTLPADAADLLDPAPTDHVPAPYPSLVTIGHDSEDGHVLLDLEHIGALTVTGDPDATREVLAAIAVELATSRWADDLQVTVVGAYPELEDALQTGRIRYLPAVGHLLEDLATRADTDRAILAEQGAPDLNHARAGGVAPDVWTPEIVLLPGHTTSGQRHQLGDLLEQLPRVAIAAVTSGDPVGEWTIRLDGDHAVLDPIGLQLRPQRIDDHAYARILDVIATADDDDPAAPADDGAHEPTLADLPPTAPEPADAAETDNGDVAGVPPAAAGPGTGVVDVQPAPAAATASPPEAEPAIPGRDAAPDPDPAAQPPVAAAAAPAPTVHTLAPRTPRLLLLGPPELIDTTGPLPQRAHATRYTELAAFLALHPDSETKTIRNAYFAAAARRPPDEAVHQAISRLRRWLGGAEFLPKNPSGGRYRLGPEVTSDWQAWCALLPGGARAATSEALEQALALVRARPFLGVDPRRYAWAEHCTQRMTEAIVDAAYELAHRRLMEGRYRSVLDATTKGLLVEPGVERLWRARILAAHAAGDQDAERDAIARLLAITTELDVDLETETTELLAQLRDPTAARIAQIAAPAL